MSARHLSAHSSTLSFPSSANGDAERDAAGAAERASLRRSMMNDEGSNSSQRAMLSFPELLSLLNVEYKRLSAENSALAAEYSRLRRRAIPSCHDFVNRDWPAATPRHRQEAATEPLSRMPAEVREKRTSSLEAPASVGRQQTQPATRQDAEDIEDTPVPRTPPASKIPRACRKPAARLPAETAQALVKLPAEDPSPCDGKVPVKPPAPDAEAGTCESSPVHRAGSGAGPRPVAAAASGADRENTPSSWLSGKANQDANAAGRATAVPIFAERRYGADEAAGNRSKFNLKWRKTTTRSRLTLDEALKTANMSIARTSKWVINPEHSRFLLHWDKVTIIALTFVAIVTPMQVAMTETRLDFLFFLNLVVDLFFFWDMVLQFFLMYHNKTNYGNVLEHRHHKIVSHYLRGWFFIDVVSILPFELVGLLARSEKVRQIKAVKTIRLLRLLKLARMMKASRLFRRLEMRMSITYQRLALLKFFIILMLITHWMANLWALTLALVDDDEGVPRWVDSFDILEENVEVKTKESLWKLYVTCLYFTSYTITSVGYGDIGPANITERIVCTLMIFVSGITWALLIAQVCSIVGSMDAEEQNFRRVMDELNFMMQDRELPMLLRRRLRSFFLSNKSAARHARQKKILEAMSPALKGEVAMEMNRVWIGKISFLSHFLEKAESRENDGCLMAFVVNVAECLEVQVHAQAEYFGRPQVLYILNRGLAAHMGRVLRSGTVWGHDFVMADIRLLEPCNSFALTYLEVTHLERNEFMRVVERHHYMSPEIAWSVRRYCVRVAVQRAILAEARARRGQVI